MKPAIDPKLLPANRLVAPVAPDVAALFSVPYPELVGVTWIFIHVIRSHNNTPVAPVSWQLRKLVEWAARRCLLMGKIVADKLTIAHMN